MLHPEPSYCAHPIDEIEPEEMTLEHREAAIKYIRTMLAIVGFLMDAKTPNDIAMRVRLVGSQFGHPTVRGKSFEDIGKECCVTRSAVSKQAKILQRTCSLPSMFGQKSEDACRTYSEIKTK